MNQRCVNACFIHLAQRIIMDWAGARLPDVDLGINN
jgi:hypothetical protein